MSYILDALKKLEEQRRLEAGSRQLSRWYSPRQKRRGHFLWRYFVFLALLLNAGILLWWAGPWQSKRSAAREPFEVSTDAAVSRQDEVVKDTVNEGRGPHLRQLQSDVGTGNDLDSKPKENGSAVSFQMHPDAAEKEVTDGKIMEMSELPLSVRQKLPDLSISGHFYENKPSSRIITVGGKTLHEGASAAPGIRLERITPDGAVFSCDGYRFHKGVF